MILTSMYIFGEQSLLGSLSSNCLPFLQTLIFGNRRCARIGSICGLWLSMVGCHSATNSPGLVNSGGTQTDGGDTTTKLVPCASAPVGPKKHDAGNYDFMTCNGANCHFDPPYVGGWVYSSASGPPWIGGTTVTILNDDGSTATAVTGPDGFFYIEGTVGASYYACVSNCPDVNCSATKHVSTDCQSASCHGQPNQKMYVAPYPWGGTNDAGVTKADAGGTNCKALANGGAYVHSAPVYGSQPCSNCHSGTPAYIGGFLYDGPASSTTVSQASITVTPASGAAVTTASGPDGMLFFGTVSAPPPATKTWSAPYTACVSKCSKTVCSTTNGHTTIDDCGTCHNGSTTRQLYLN